MPSLEQYCYRFFRQRQLGITLLIGGILAFIPIANILALGYIWRHVRRIHQGSTELPEWNDWKNLFLDGLRMLLVGLLYMGVPLLLGILLCRLFVLITLGMLGWLPWFFISASLLIGTFLLASAVQWAVSSSEWKPIFEFRLIANKALQSFPVLIVPVFAFWGILSLGAPLYGFTTFFALLVFLPYSGLAIRSSVPN